jgi:hypothetical protein
MMLILFHISRGALCMQLEIACRPWAGLQCEACTYPTPHLRARFQVARAHAEVTCRHKAIQLRQGLEHSCTKILLSRVAVCMQGAIACPG